MSNTSYIKRYMKQMREKLPVKSGEYLLKLSTGKIYKCYKIYYVNGDHSRNFKGNWKKNGYYGARVGNRNIYSLSGYKIVDKPAGFDDPKWIQTDNTDSISQYARKINTYVWEYKQIQNGEIKSATINLEEYTLQEIADEISSFGYTIVPKCTSVQSKFKLYQSQVYKITDSIQLACECIFENNIIKI